MAKAKKARKPAKRARKPRQGYLDGMDPPSIPEIDRAADNYVSVRDSRMALTEEESEAKAILQAVMVKHQLTTYDYDGKTVILDTEPSVKVRKKKAEPDAEEE